MMMVLMVLIVLLMILVVLLLLLLLALSLVLKPMLHLVKALDGAVCVSCPILGSMHLVRFHVRMGWIAH